MPETEINTLADLLAELRAFRGDPKTTPIYLADGFKETRLHVAFLEDRGKHQIRFQCRLDHEFVVAGMRRRLRDSEEEIAKLVEKIERNRRDLGVYLEARDQCITMLDMVAKVDQQRKKGR